jgi:hypothetical protein
MRLAPPNLSRRYTAVMAVKVLPAPVAMCTSARGLFCASDFSRPVTALIWQSRRLRSGSAGMLWPGGGAGCQAAPAIRPAFGREEVEDFARTRRGVGVVGEADDLARGFEQEAQRGVVFAPFEVGGGVALGLASVTVRFSPALSFLASITPTACG